VRYIAVIPSRMESKRLPGKPLKKIGKKSMIQRVYEQSIRCKRFEKVFVATDSQEIKNHVENFSEVIMTSSKPSNGTERVSEALNKINISYDYVINIQGDEPFIKNNQIDNLIHICDGKNQICSLVKKTSYNEKLKKNSIIKVVMDKEKNALYFSRNIIPSYNESAIYYKHIGLYGFKKNIIEKITKLPKSELEKIESLEQLRWLENNYKIKLAITKEDSFGIDTEEDLINANKIVLNI
tara:strand:+ start:1415 stop:2131 length:717 start_codon:yes stop_codon:yes gene_type:complete